MRLNEKCESCNEWHESGPCYPSDDERGREDGWRLYKAIKTQTFPSVADTEREEAS